MEKRDIESLGESGVLINILDKLGVKESAKVAGRLLERFGSFNGIFSATNEEILSLGVVSERVASFLGFVRPMFRQAMIRGASDRFVCERDLIRYITAHFFFGSSPDCYCIYTLERKPINTIRLFSENRLREIIGNACRLCADGLIFVRYAADRSSLVPDSAEMSFVSELVETCELAEKSLIDYIVYTPYEFFGYKRFLSDHNGIADVLDSSLTPYNK